LIDIFNERDKHLCCARTAQPDSADGDGVDIEARTCGSIHSKSKRCEPARVGFELALGEAVTAIQLGNCDLLRCWLNEIDGARLCGP
jgi:hypothetical protein